MIEPRHVGRGFLIGMVDAVPGVSGGTMALVLGIYDRFIAALAGLSDWVKTRRLADGGFLLALLIGMVPGLYVGARGLVIALDAWPMMMSAMFLMLIVASLPSVLRQTDGSWGHYGFAFLGLVAAWGLTVLSPASGASWYWLPVFGAIAITAMLLPGISGSFVLLLLGAYETTLDAVVAFDVAYLALLGIGAVVGLIVTSRGLRRLLNTQSGPTHAVMVGLLVGSLGRLWPWRTELEFAAGLPAAPVSLGAGEVLLGALIGLAAGLVLAKVAANE